MNEFDIIIPNESELVIDVTDNGLYDYNFEAFSLSGLQEVANAQVNSKILNKFTNMIVGNTSTLGELKNLLDSQEADYVADLSKVAKEKLASGEWKLGVRAKTGETYAIIKDAATGRSQSFVTLKEKVTTDLGMLPQLAAVQYQLKEISEQIQTLTQAVTRVEQGQYDDRYAGFISSRQMVLEGMSVSDETIRKNLLSSAINLNNETIGKLMFSIHRNSLELIDDKTKTKDIIRLEKHLTESLSYLNASVQLNVVAYTTLGEAKAISTSLRNYKAFVDQTLLSDKTKDNRSIAWLIDNHRKEDDGQFLEISQKVSEKIESLIINKPIEIGEEGNERIEEESL
ncbi:hypothetical protein [Vagococcus hydrophili]|uniref:Uncharacterized protein n=1 Tax=Vagococcus hydrophili TaxID=2714947 RepID=A0A6G8AU60_9ENTE|nr:hypothetical protein [Vagococcus hydrophili]QIL48509.1 hypothetical protein G7082_08350 [Vagococcus hydrophili]